MPVSVRKAPRQVLGAAALMQNALHSATKGVKLMSSPGLVGKQDLAPQGRER